MMERTFPEPEGPTHIVNNMIGTVYADELSLMRTSAPFDSAAIVVNNGNTTEDKSPHFCVAYA
jgi:hypothetical protein